MRPIVSCPLLLLLLAPPGFAGDWPGWRGPRGDGISTEVGVPLTWSPSQNIAWKTPLPGTGRSSPIVVGERVFVTAADSSDRTRRVLCLHADSGRILWNSAVHQGEPGQMHKFNTAASSTPTSDGERVYAVFIDDQTMHVAALDLEGRLIWTVSPGTFHSQHGFAASPVVFGNGLIVNGQQDGSAFVVMLERSTGKELWRYTPAINLRSFATPLLIAHDGQPQLILSGSSQTAALNPQSGELLWWIDGPAEKFVSTPAVGHGLVFSFGGSPDKKAMAVRLGGRGLLPEQSVVWRNERQMPYVPTPLLLGDYLHILNDAGIYSCLEAKTGRVLMTSRKTGPAYSSPVAIRDRIYFFEDSGKCTVISQGTGFEVLASNELGEEVYATPAVAHQSLFVRTSNHLIRISQTPSAPGSGASE